MVDYEVLRQRMVEEQLIPRGISGRRVLEAFLNVPRHEFVPEEFRDTAYGDHPIPIGLGQTISQPYMVALMTECLGLSGGEKVLEIGCGSGYQAAILAHMGADVITVERVGELAALCRQRLGGLGYEGIRVVTGDGTLGHAGGAPYDGIIVTCAAPSVPDTLTGQLRDGGRLVIPVGARFSQALTVITKKGGFVTAREICGCVFVPLIGEKGWKE
ncbi:MAG: protein-L-isoaspartate(D-aspartate) O-methyltransferase [Candidatus Omnitrophota bacterium]